MMVQIMNRYIKNGHLVLDLGGNHNICRICVTGKAIDESKLRISYAQNGIESELLPFGELQGKNGDCLVFEPEIPVEVSHVYIYANEPESLEAELIEYKLIPFEKCYPRYVDLELEENYILDSVSVVTQAEEYSVYTSLNGSDFTFLGKNEKDTFDAGGREARFIRVLLEYHSESCECDVDQILYTGKKSHTPIQKPVEIKVPDYEQTEYSRELTEEDTYDEIYGIIERRIGAEYKNWFLFQLCPNPDSEKNYDYFELSDFNDRIFIRGNSGVSVCMGLNWYLKYYCRVNISQVGDQVRMPARLIPVGGKIHKETKAKIRYAYNYCTLSYSMAFWGEEQWRRELDWLALNGVNVVLDTTAQEEVWRRFLTEIGYQQTDIMKYIAGPAYYAWSYMANIYGYGGPLHHSWFGRRTELARKNHLIMRKLGMFPVLQGYSGAVPVDIQNYDKDIEVIGQGTWCSFTRPSMIKTTTSGYQRYAELFYRCQRQVYGDYSCYYAADPFHEGGNCADMSQCEISKEVLAAMLRENKKAVWIIQSWQNNPSSELLKGIEAAKDHALILDLYAEKTPHHQDGCAGNPYHGYQSEFNNTPWVYCMLNNFGGRLGLHGHLDNLVREIPKALNHCRCIAGIGITPEASENNPVLYDFLFEAVWQDNASEYMEEADIDQWLKNYAERRYGVKSVNAERAWDILKSTVYKAELNMLGQGAPECVVNARPSLKVRSASSWGNAEICYEYAQLEKALALLAEDYERLKYSQGYLYDLTSLTLQVLSNNALQCHKNLSAAFKAGNAEAFEKYGQEFLEIAEDMDKAASGNFYYLLGRWISYARKLGENTDDYSKWLYEFNARSLITTWGSYNQSEIGGLHDYSNRQWGGLVKDFYKPRWEQWLQTMLHTLRTGIPAETIDCFKEEWKWVRSSNEYSAVPTELNLMDIVNKLIKEEKIHDKRI